ncbi:uncharacterized protein [Procambarus clarkii]|uniref:uncharacterized protein n=1 Tax=Procambarus clarkii TaxID=6728 RepID=UPI001E6716AC|nr:uncharacterized protein LOC123774395 [Procambarus clarkii]
MKVVNVILTSMQVFALFPFYKRNAEVFKLSKLLLLWCVLNCLLVCAACVSLFFIPAEVIAMNKTNVMTNRQWKYVWISLGFSRIVALLKSPVLATIVDRVERLRALKKVPVKLTKSDALIMLAVVVLLIVNIHEIYKLIMLIKRQSEENKAWWVLLPYLLCYVCGLLSHLLAPAMFYVLSQHLTRALQYTVPALNDPAWQGLPLPFEDRRTSLIQFLTRKRDRKVSTAGEVTPSDAQKSYLKSDFLSEAETLLLDVDETLSDLLEYIGLYMVFLLVAMVLTLIVLMYTFVDSLVQENTEWKPLANAVVYSVVFLYVNTAADDFSSERERCAGRYRRLLQIDPSLQDDPRVYRLLGMLERHQEFTLAGFVSLGRGTVATTASFIISYVVIALQFRGE